MKLKVTKSRSAAKEEEVREPENIAVVDDAAKTMDDAMPEDDEAVRETVAKEEITEEVAKEEKEELHSLRLRRHLWRRRSQQPM